MSREETIQALFDAFNRRELDAMLPHLDEDVEMVPLRAEVEDIRYRGHAQMADFLDDVESTWAGMQIEVEEIRAEGDRYVVVGRMRGIGSVSGASTELRAGWVAAFRDDRVSYLKTFSDPDAASAEAAEAS